MQHKCTSLILKKSLVLYADDVSKLIMTAMQRSTCICEICSKYGKERNYSGWIRILCEDCHSKETKTIYTSIAESVSPDHQNRCIYNQHNYDR